MARKPAKGPGGRPTKYQPAYCEQLVEHMSEGASLLSFAAEIDVDRSTLTEWAKVHPEFSTAVTRGKAKCAAWWERIGRNLAMTGEGNATLVVFGLKNMGAEEWADRQSLEHTGKDGGPIQTEATVSDDLRQALDAIAGKITGGLGAGEVAGNSEADADNPAG